LKVWKEYNQWECRDKKAAVVHSPNYGKEHRCLCAQTSVWLIRNVSLNLQKDETQVIQCIQRFNLRVVYINLEWIHQLIGLEQFSQSNRWVLFCQSLKQLLKLKRSAFREYLGLALGLLKCYRLKTEPSFTGLQFSERMHWMPLKSHNVHNVHNLK